MKEKLLQLIYACINDEAMFIHKYANDKYIGINERIDTRRTSYVAKAELNGKNIEDNAKYVIGLEKETTYANFYELAIGFGNEPQLTIYPTLKGNNEQQKRTVIQSIGTRDYLFCKIPKTFDVTIVTEERHYELRCGSFAFIIDADVVKDIHDKIKAKRFEIASRIELATINERLDKYQIK